MQSARVKAMLITNYYGLSSIVKHDVVRRVLCNSVKRDSWLIKQSENVEGDIDVLDAARSTPDGPLQKQKVRNIERTF
jgi:hypothetical protein